MSTPYRSGDAPTAEDTQKAYDVLRAALHRIRQSDPGDSWPAKRMRIIATLALSEADDPDAILRCYNCGATHPVNSFYPIQYIGFGDVGGQICNDCDKDLRKEHTA